MFAALLPWFLTPLFELLRTCLWAAVLLMLVLVREAREEVADFADALVRFLYLGSPEVDAFALPVDSLDRDEYP